MKKSLGAELTTNKKEIKNEEKLNCRSKFQFRVNIKENEEKNQISDIG